MGIEVCTIGGFSECGRNCTAVRVDDEVVILDIGLEMENYIRHTQSERENLVKLNYKDLVRVNAVPNLDLINDWKDKVVAIVPSHAHLDHIGAIPFAAPMFPKVPIISTPYTVEVIKSILKDERIRLKNRLIGQNPNSKYKLSDKITIEFVNITHSIPHTAIVVLHTPYGKVMYANDYKIDLTPTLGQKPNFKRLKELAEEGIDLLISETLYADHHSKCPSEAIARQMLRDLIAGTDHTGQGIIVTTFASHIARLKSAIEIGKKLDRKIVLFGRSLKKYITAAENIGIINFSKDVKMYSRRHELEKVMRQINKEGMDKYMIICTGHQGEPGAVLSRISDGRLPLKLSKRDLVVFSCSVIPVELNIQNRLELERKLKGKGARLFVDVHVSGHGHREDYRELIEMIKPKHVIPAHAGHQKAEHMKELCLEIGYVDKETFHMMENGKRLLL